jgi:hypothetical protein
LDAWWIFELRIFRNKCVIFRNKCLILFLKFLNLLLSIRMSLRGKVLRFRLFAYRMKFVAKHGRNWRLCLFDDEVVEFLETVEYVHNVLMPNEPISPTTGASGGGAQPKERIKFEQLLRR